MLNQKVVFNKNKLVIAVSVAILSGVMGGCSSSSSNSAAAAPEAPVVPMVLLNGGSGGNSENSNGGEGGYLYAYNEGGSGGIDVLTTGAANTAFTSPAAINSASANLGDNPLNVTADTTLSLTVTTSYYPVYEGNNVAANTVYMGSDMVLRTSGPADPDPLIPTTANYATDALVADGRLYTSRYENELYQAVGDDTLADLAAAGINYQKNNGSWIYLSDADDSTVDSAYSGISIATGATLTMVASDSGCVNVAVSNDIDNNGTITKQNEVGSCDDLTLNTDSYFATGEIVNAGTVDKTDGGFVGIYASTGIKNNGLINVSGFNDTADDSGGSGGDIDLSASGYILNNALLNASGGDGAGASSGGDVDLYADYYTENNGVIDASGGTDTRSPADASSGGSGSTIYVEAGRVVNNTAMLDATGGNGSEGGSAGEIYIENDNISGEAKNSGMINLVGGTGSDGDGGSGGGFYLESSNGHALSSSDIDVSGGDTTAATGSYDGGEAGNIEFYATYDDSNLAIGDVIVSGNLKASGGNAPADSDGHGGGAGYIQLENNNPRDLSTENTARVALLGYGSIDVSGGDATDGGTAYCCDDSIYLATSYDSNNALDHQAAAGSIVNEVPMDVSGGDSIASGTGSGEGGYAGSVYMYVPNYVADGVTLVATVTNTAAINLNGGNAFGDTASGMDGGEGGYFEMEALGNVDNSGVLTANGGSGGADGGQGGGFYAYSEQGNASNTGEMTANGGNGSRYGAEAGYLELYANTGLVTNSANLTVNGGNASDAIDSEGGYGGYIGVGYGLNPVNTGTLSYAAGTGETAGEEGCAYVGIFAEGNCNNNN